MSMISRKAKNMSVSQDYFSILTQFDAKIGTNCGGITEMNLLHLLLCVKEKDILIMAEYIILHDN